MTQLKINDHGCRNFLLSLMPIMRFKTELSRNKKKQGQLSKSLTESCCVKS